MAQLIVQGDGELTGILRTAWNAIVPAFSPHGEGAEVHEFD